MGTAGGSLGLNLSGIYVGGNWSEPGAEAVGCKGGLGEIWDCKCQVYTENDWKESRAESVGHVWGSSGCEEGGGGGGGE